MAIEPLSEETVRLLAAGEVIDSLAAVVRELVDNSLDAGADRIRVNLWPDQWRIQVQDNGSGISETDLLWLAQSHTTSKLRHVGDLQALHTLGFRGEGLHSIAVVSDLEVHTSNSGLSRRARYDHEGNLSLSEAAAAAPGTVVTVHELFARQPVRRRFLADRRQQIRQVTQMLQRYALGFPSNLFELAVDGRITQKLWPAPGLRERVLQLLPQHDEHDLREATSPDQQVRLVLGLPDRCSRSRSDWIYLFINRRFIRHLDLEASIQKGFERTLRRGRYPVCVVHLTLPSQVVDWNRHPAKLEVQLAQTDLMAAQIIATIGTALREFAPRPAPDLLRLAEANAGYNAESPQGGLLKALSQMQNTYILAEYPGGLCLVEQHVAHERILFEALEISWQLVPIDPPIALELSDSEADNLQLQGLELEAFGPRTWLIRTIPKLLLGRDDCQAGLKEMASYPDLQDMRVALACRTAIRNGTPLSPARMQSLIDQWQRTRNPHTCPHGRPIYMPLTDGELARFFRRRWHICGS
jgi:DNA mismatch repair protein MutL